MKPEELAAIRHRDAEYPQGWIDYYRDEARPQVLTIADRRALLAEVDRLTAALAAAEARVAASEHVHGYCVCDGNLRARDCGVKAHRDAAKAKVADAWDEGYGTGVHDQEIAAEQPLGHWVAPARANPYREAL